MEFQHCFDVNRPILRQHLECGYGLLDELSSRAVLSREQVADIDRPQTSKYEQNDKLLSILRHSIALVDPGMQASLAEALRLTHQGHLAMYFSGDIDGMSGRPFVTCYAALL